MGSRTRCDSNETSLQLVVRDQESAVAVALLRAIVYIITRLFYYFKMGDQELNLKFVGEVEKHEELYNYKLPGYSRKDVTEKAWQQVAIEMNMSGM